MKVNELTRGELNSSAAPSVKSAIKSHGTLYAVVTTKVKQSAEAIVLWSIRGRAEVNKRENRRKLQQTGSRKLSNTAE